MEKGAMAMMKMSSLFLVCVVLLLESAASQVMGVRVFSMNPDQLLKNQKEIVAGNKAMQAALKRLRKDADKALGLSPVSVMEKSQTPPSGDKHDYMSLARYFWPDPTKPDGLPYVQRDGETNPEIKTVTDQENLQQVIKGVHTLGLAYFFTANEEYAEHATKLLRAWFLNPETKMNPNLNFAQAVKGKSDGRSWGLIDVRGFADLIDGVGLLAGSQSWTIADQRGLVEWFSQYLSWLQTNPNAILEAAAANNHGVWFDVQIASIALFVGKNDVARKILEEAKTKRIATQIEPDGTQPRELARTRSMHYTAFTLEAYARLAQLADRIGIDLWNYQSPDGRSIHKALDWFLPHYLGDQEWTYKQIDTYKKEAFYSVLLLASVKYGDDKYSDAGRKYVGENGKTDKVNLMYGN